MPSRRTWTFTVQQRGLTRQRGCGREDLARGGGGVAGGRAHLGDVLCHRFGALRRLRHVAGHLLDGGVFLLDGAGAALLRMKDARVEEPVHGRLFTPDIETALREPRVVKNRAAIALAGVA